MLLYLQVAVREGTNLIAWRLLLVESHLDQCQHWSSGFVGDGIWACIADWKGWIRSSRSRVHRVYGGDPLGLWGETDPEEPLLSG